MCTPENSKRAHLSAPALQTPPKIPREDPQRGKERIFVAEREKEREILGPPTLRSPTFRGPTLRGPHPSESGVGCKWFWDSTDAIPVRQTSSRVPKRLRLTGHHHGTAPTDDICDALEFDLTQGDSSGLGRPHHRCLRHRCHRPFCPPPCVAHTQVDSDVGRFRRPHWDRPTSPPPSFDSGSSI